MRITVYDRDMAVIRKDGTWQVFYLSGDGKRRRAHDIVIPSHIPENELIRYLEDLLHEWHRPG